MFSQEKEVLGLAHANLFSYRANTDRFVLIGKD